MHPETLLPSLIGQLTSMPYVACLDLQQAVTEAIGLLCQRSQKNGKLFMDSSVAESLQTIVQTCCKEQGITLVTGRYAAFCPDDSFLGAFVQFPNADGNIEDYTDLADELHQHKLLLVVAADLFSLAMLQPAGAWGADIVIGDTHPLAKQLEIGNVPSGFLATSENCKLASTHTLDPSDSKAVVSHLNQLSLQAQRIHGMTAYLNDALEVYGYQQENNAFFNTLKISLPDNLIETNLRTLADDYDIRLHNFPDNRSIGICLEASTDNDDLEDLLNLFAEATDNFTCPVQEADWQKIVALDDSLLRNDLAQS